MMLDPSSASSLAKDHVNRDAVETLPIKVIIPTPTNNEINTLAAVEERVA